MPEYGFIIMIKNQDGFTIIELLISMVILVVGILTLQLLQITAIKGNYSSKKISEATNLAENKIEELVNLNYNDGDLAEGLYVETQDGYDISWDVSDDAEVNGTKTLAISVTWSDGGIQRTISIQNVKGRIQ